MEWWGGVAWGDGGRVGINPTTLLPRGQGRRVGSVMGRMSGTRLWGNVG